MLQMTRERKRRKKLDLPKLDVVVEKKLGDFARAKRGEVPEGAGYEEAPTDEVSPTTKDDDVPFIGPLLDVEQSYADPLAKERRERQKCDAKARKLLGNTARIINLKGRTKSNGLLVELDYWDSANQIYECRLVETKTVIKYRCRTSPH